jgi:2-polyprenyl-3-methyl-5-hydroxy-6-metoxy-1,4-benzoquinol methylase
MYRSAANAAAQKCVVVATRSRRELQDYWKEPWDGDNAPESFIAPENPRRSEYLAGIVQECVAPTASILEIGCNVGRNLHYLRAKGFSNLTGIEISDNAVRLLRATFPELAATATIHHAAVEDVIKNFGDRQFDFVFSMELFAHIPRDSEWVFRDVARIANRYLFTVEDEGCQSWRDIPRNYRKVFEPLGWKQIRQETGWDAIGLGGGVVARLFTRGTGA